MTWSVPMCSHPIGLVQEATSDDREWEVTELSNATADLGTTQDIMNFLFATVTVVALFLCFFSLMASMVTNIREQTKEAGVLRALGLKYVDIFCVAVTALWWLTCCPSWSCVCVVALAWCACSCTRPTRWCWRRP